MDTIATLHQLRIEAWEVKALLWDRNFLTPTWWFIATIITAAIRFLNAVSRVIFDDWGITSGRWTYVMLQ